MIQILRLEPDVGFAIVEYQVLYITVMLLTVVPRYPLKCGDVVSTGTWYLNRYVTGFGMRIVLDNAMT